MLLRQFRLPPARAALQPRNPATPMLTAMQGSVRLPSDNEGVDGAKRELKSEVIPQLRVTLSV
jgi:hypothetical protein